MSLLVEALLLLCLFLISRHFVNNDIMDDNQDESQQRLHLRPRSRFRGRRGPRTVLPSYPHHNKAETTSEISGSFIPDSKDTESNNTEFYPSLEDVSQVRNIFRGLWSLSSRKESSNRRRPTPLALPDEVIDIILDEAEYWPSVVTTLNTTPFVIAADGDRECLKTPPLCYSLAKDGHKPRDRDSNSTTTTSEGNILLHRGVNPCRKIVFDISSHDQGWGGELPHRNTFQGSWTWFDAYIGPPNMKETTGDRRTSDSTTTTAGESPASESDSSSSGSTTSVSSVEEKPSTTRLRPFLPEATKLQCNRTATINSTDYHIVWHYRDNISADSPEAEQIERETGRGLATLDGKAVRNMCVGDVVSVWLRARFAGWRNHVDKMSVRVFWAA